jgi:adenosine deaminase
LTTEYLRLAATFGYGAADLARFASAAVRHSFLPEDDRRVLEASIASQPLP